MLVTYANSDYAPLHYAVIIHKGCRCDSLASSCLGYFDWKTRLRRNSRDFGHSGAERFLGVLVWADSVGIGDRGVTKLEK